MENKVYADNAATTKLSDNALKAMFSFLTDRFENPSAGYSDGVYERSIVEAARGDIARLLKAYGDRSIIFTSGGSESDSLALLGIMDSNKEKGRHLVTTDIEHHAVLNACRFLEEHGFRVTYVHAGESGVVNPSDIEAAICEDTVLVSVMYINNEVGTIQPISEIGSICRKKGVLFHTDAVQAFGKVPIDVEKQKIDLLSASAHKFGGPKGTGFLYIRNGLNISPVIFGGSQEGGRRGGTENVPGIVGMAVAAGDSCSKMVETGLLLSEYRDLLWNRIVTEIEGVHLNGAPSKRYPGIINFSVDGVEGESLLIQMDMNGVMVSTGSACALAFNEPSHVLKALGRTDMEAASSIRISLSNENTIEDCNKIADALKESVSYLRALRG